MEKFRLLTFPFAGGNKHSYLKFGENKPENIEFVYLEGPGRGERFKEPLLDEMTAVLEDFYRQILPYLDAPFAFYGHSMGAMVSYLLARRLKEEGKRTPAHLFLSGRVAPTCQDPGDKLWSKDKTTFWDAVKDYGGSPEELFNYPELLALYEPMIRADLKTLDSYNHHRPEPLDIPMTVMLGTKEKVTLLTARPWQEECAQPITIRQFEGNHFWIFNHIPALNRIFTETLATSTND